MKRQRVELADVACRDNLTLALWKAAQGKRQRPAVARFLAQADERLARLAQRILAGQAPLGRSRRFVIHDPKRREITVACFEDRVLHHAMLNVAEARFERALVSSGFACRPGKGVHAAVAAVQQGLQRWPWVVQADVAGYFGSIQHGLLMQQLGCLFKGDAFLRIWDRVLAAGSVQPGVGLPIGALTSQHLANYHLGVADRLLLNHPGVGAHVRSRRLVDQPPRQRPLGLPQQETPGQSQPQPGLPLCTESLWRIPPRPLVRPKRRCSSLQMLAVARAAAVLCASINPVSDARSDAPERSAGFLLLRQVHQRRWCAPLAQHQDQRRRPVAWLLYRAAACKPQGPQGAGRQQALLPNAPWVAPFNERAC